MERPERDNFFFGSSVLHSYLFIIVKQLYLSESLEDVTISSLYIQNCGTIEVTLQERFHQSRMRTMHLCSTFGLTYMTLFRDTGAVDLSHIPCVDVRTYQSLNQ